MLLAEEVQNGQTATVAEVALAFPHSTDILHRYHLDFCCHGKLNFVEACRLNNLDSDKIWQEILNTRADNDSTLKFDSWDAELLIEYILQHHHQYIRQAIPQINELLAKVCEVHGSEQPVLYEIRDTFVSLADELLDHLPKEEDVLFPAMRKLAQLDSDLIRNTAFIRNLQAPISVMEHEHDSAGTFLKSLRSLTSNYAPPAFACPTYQLTFKLLEEFDRDLIQHIHLENNILFPKVTSSTN